jgi:hypothetical protein
MTEIDNNAPNSQINALERAAVGNGLLILSWILAGSVSVVAVAELTHVGDAPEQWGSQLSCFGMMALCLAGFTCWPIGLWLIGPRLKQGDASSDILLSRRACRATAVIHGVWAIGIPLCLFVDLWGDPLETWTSPAAVAGVNLLTLSYARCAGSLAKHLKSLRLAWLFWLWIPISLFAAGLCLATGGPHWIIAIGDYARKGAVLGYGITALIALPILVAHIWLHWRLARTIRQMRAGEPKLRKGCA